MVSAKKEPRGGDPGASTETNSEHLPSTSGEESRPAYEVIAALAEAYPKCFVVYEKYSRPLKLGIHRDLIAARQIPEDEILNALRMYVANLRYLKKLRAGAVRIGLDGEIRPIADSARSSRFNS